MSLPKKNHIIENVSAKKKDVLDLLAHIDYLTSKDKDAIVHDLENVFFSITTAESLTQEYVRAEKKKEDVLTALELVETELSDFSFSRQQLLYLLSSGDRLAAKKVTETFIDAVKVCVDQWKKIVG